MNAGARNARAERNAGARNAGARNARAERNAGARNAGAERNAAERNAAPERNAAARNAASRRSKRQDAVEAQAMRTFIDRVRLLGLKVHHIAPDGNCLFGSIGADAEM
ncbi:hypothetical protein T492DRAFT_120671 [Pavlovales sp. CCMP2436]|nr:hypothetical protein T492DRAFT_120671 [Pavlovales sp. CCMP2436]